MHVDNVDGTAESMYRKKPNIKKSLDREIDIDVVDLPEGSDIRHTRDFAKNPMHNNEKKNE